MGKEQEAWGKSKRHQDRRTTFGRLLINDSFVWCTWSLACFLIELALFHFFPHPSQFVFEIYVRITSVWPSGISCFKAYMGTELALRFVRSDGEGRGIWGQQLNLPAVGYLYICWLRRGEQKFKREVWGCAVAWGKLRTQWPRWQGSYYHQLPRTFLSATWEGGATAKCEADGIPHRARLNKWEGSGFISFVSLYYQGKQLLLFPILMDY